MEEVNETSSTTTNASGASQIEGNQESAGAAQVAPVTQEPWYSQYPEDMHQYLSKFKNPTDCFKSGLHASSLLGKRMDELQEADIEAYGKLMNQMNGAPEKAEDYNIDLLPENENLLNDKGLDFVKKMSHSMSLNSEQANCLYQVINNTLQYESDAAKKQYVDNMNYCNDVLEKAWGKTAPQMQKAVVACVENVIPKISGLTADEAMDMMNNMQGKEAALVYLLAGTVGKFVTEQGNRGYADVSPVDAKLRLDNMMNDKEMINKMLDLSDPSSRALRMNLMNTIAMSHNGR